MKDRILRILPMIDLLVIEVVDEGGEAPRLVLPRKRHSRNIPDKHCVKVFCHFQVVAGTQGLEIRQNRSVRQNSSIKLAGSKFSILRSPQTADDIAGIFGLSVLSGTREPKRDVLTEQKQQVDSFSSGMKESAASHSSQMETGHSSAPER